MPRQQIGMHRDIAELITSQEADEVTPMMSKIYYRLIVTPPEWWDSSESLRVKGSTHEGVSNTAWAELVNWLRVTPEEAQKALSWLNEKEVINYQSQYSGREIGISFTGLYFSE